MAKTKLKKRHSNAAKKSSGHSMSELEDQFQCLQDKLAKARETYLATHQDEVVAARERMQQVQVDLGKARKKAARAALEARQTGTRSAKNQLEKAQAASLLLTDSLKEAKELMVTAQSKLHAAKPFDRKLAARAKVLAKFEKDWDRKMQEQAATKAARAKKAAAKRRKTARKRAVKIISRGAASDN